MMMVPIFVILVGRVTEVSPLQEEKAPSPNSYKSTRVKVSIINVCIVVLNVDERNVK